jgi:hypothetical protein
MEKQGRLKSSATHDKLLAEFSELQEALGKGDNVVKEMEIKVKKVEAEKKEIDRQVIMQLTVKKTDLLTLTRQYLRVWLL